MVEFNTALVYNKLFEFNCSCFGFSRKNILLVFFSLLHFFTDLPVFHVAVFHGIEMSLLTDACSVNCLDDFIFEQVSTRTLLITTQWWVNNRRQVLLKWTIAILTDQAFIIFTEWPNPPPPLTHTHTHTYTHTHTHTLPPPRI